MSATARSHGVSYGVTLAESAVWSSTFASGFLEENGKR